MGRGRNRLISCCDKSAVKCKRERDVDILREAICEDEGGIAQPANEVVISTACITVTRDGERLLCTDSPFFAIRVLSG